MNLRNLTEPNRIYSPESVTKGSTTHEKKAYRYFTGKGSSKETMFLQQTKAHFYGYSVLLKCMTVKEPQPV